MSKLRRRLRRLTCQRKHRYPTEAAAQQGVRRLMMQSTYDGLPIQVYRCQFCPGWHFGHAPEWKPEAKPERTILT